jgi:hypothetical protein
MHPLHLRGVWLGVNLRMDSRIAHVHRDGQDLQIGGTYTVIR